MKRKLILNIIMLVVVFIFSIMGYLINNKQTEIKEINDLILIKDSLRIKINENQEEINSNKLENIKKLEIIDSLNKVIKKLEKQK